MKTRPLPGFLFLLPPSVTVRRLQIRSRQATISDIIQGSPSLMKLLVVSGRSGSGKTSALHVLEDLGYYCVDNLPVALLPALADTFGQSGETSVGLLAVGIDARNLPTELTQMPRVVKTLRDQGVNVEIIYLDARDDILLKRFHATRRKHPLSNANRSLQEAIALEGQLLDEVSGLASLRVDTSDFNVHELRDEFRQRIATHEAATMAILFESFAFKHGVPIDADFVFDARCLPNPHWHPDLQDLTGLDQPVAEFLEKQAVVEKFSSHVKLFLEEWLPLFGEADRSYITVAIGCTGGQHRSVYLTELLARHFQQKLPLVQVRHRELNRQGGRHG